MQDILNELDVRICDSGLISSDHIFNSVDIKDTINKLNLNKSDGSCALSTDHLLRAGPDLSVYTAFLFSCMVIHCSAPKDFSVSIIIPIPKHRILILLLVIISMALLLVQCFVKYLITSS
jgi:hypothetical protein